VDFNVAQLLKQPVGATRHFDIHEEPGRFDEGLVTTSPLSGHLRFMRTRRGLLVTFHAHTTVLMQCVRCLDEVAIPVDVDFEEELLQTYDVLTGVRLPDVPHDDPAILIDHNHEVHLRELIRQYLIVSLPMKPICREGECRGLCPQCGANLNLDPSHHHDGEIDERWSSLRVLLRSESPDKR
jgi:uncharacterized protein